MHHQTPVNNARQLHGFRRRSLSRTPMSSSRGSTPTPRLADIIEKIGKVE
jgi:hypothetical protein